MCSLSLRLRLTRLLLLSHPRSRLGFSLSTRGSCLFALHCRNGSRALRIGSRLSSLRLSAGSIPHAFLRCGATRACYTSSFICNSNNLVINTSL